MQYWMLECYGNVRLFLRSCAYVFMWMVTLNAMPQHICKMKHSDGQHNSEERNVILKIVIPSATEQKNEELYKVK